MSAAFGQAAASKVDLGVGLHLHEGEDLLVARLVDEAGAQQVVDAQGLAGSGRPAGSCRSLETGCAVSDRSRSTCCRRRLPRTRCATPHRWRWRSCC